MKKIIFFLFSISLLILLTACSNQEPGLYDEFATCLTEQGVRMYGTEWCGACATQKEIFGNSFRNVEYIDCERNRDTCLRNGVRAYPTWLAQGVPYEGVQNIEQLAEISGCEL